MFSTDVDVICTDILIAYDYVSIFVIYIQHIFGDVKHTNVFVGHTAYFELFGNFPWWKITCKTHFFSQANRKNEIIDYELYSFGKSVRKLRVEIKSL